MGIRSFFSLCLIAFLYWTSAQGEDKAVGRLDSMTAVVVDADVGVPEVRESITLTSSAEQGAGGLEVGGGSDNDPGPGNTSRLPDRLVYGGIQAVIAAEYMYRL